MDEGSMAIGVAIVQEDDSDLALEQFEKTLLEKDMPIEQKEALMRQAVPFAQSEIIVSFLKSSELNEWVHTKELDESEAISGVENGDLDALIRIPEGFTYEVLTSLLLGEPADTALVIQSEEESSEVNTLQRIVDNFIHTLNYQFALETVTDASVATPHLPQGGRVVMDDVETYTMPQYLTIAMGTLFALFLSSTVAIKAFTEKREHVFHRILLSGSNHFQYLMGKTLAAFCLSWLQIMITIGLSQLFLGVFDGKSLDFWLGLMVVITAYALAIAGLTAFFTSLTLKVKDVNAANGIQSVVVIGFGIFGGGFFPIQGLPEVFQLIGGWTPNGITQTALMEWIQLSQLQNLLQPILLLIGISAVLFAIGVSIFPKRGKIS